MRQSAHGRTVRRPESDIHIARLNVRRQVISSQVNSTIQGRAPSRNVAGCGGRRAWQAPVPVGRSPHSTRISLTLIRATIGSG
jgi:hypothetical protein